MGSKSTKVKSALNKVPKEKPRKEKKIGPDLGIKQDFKLEEKKNLQ